MCINIGGIVSLKSDTEKIIKILCLNIGIGAVDTIIFSPGLLGIGIVGANAWSYSHIHERYKETKK